jgi:hypothetical protein
VVLEALEFQVRLEDQRNFLAVEVEVVERLQQIQMKPMDLVVQVEVVSAVRVVVAPV